MEWKLDYGAGDATQDVNNKLDKLDKLDRYIKRVDQLRENKEWPQLAIHLATMIEQCIELKNEDTISDQTISSRPLKDKIEEQEDIGMLVGEVISNVDYSSDDEILRIKTLSGREFMMYHQQDCCETVYLEDGLEELRDLMGEEVCGAREDISTSGDTDEGTEKWTYYHIATKTQNCCLRWYGSSNGYYSEEVSFEEIK